METQSTTVLFRISQLKFLPGNMVFVSQLSNVSIPEISKNASACITVTESPWGQCFKVQNTPPDPPRRDNQFLWPTWATQIPVESCE